MRVGTAVSLDSDHALPRLFPGYVANAGILRGLPNVVRVEGHTDDVPMRGGRFKSNWELSAARAQSVVRILMREGLDPRRIQVVGFADVRPREPNETAPGRAANRRIELKLLKGAE